jgi:DNA-binding NarL/FixJ family response regulator
MRHVPSGLGDAVERSPLRVIVADDDPMARRVVRDALDTDGITVVAEAATGQEAVELTLYYKPDVVLMDLVMPDGDGIEATGRIVDAEPDTSIVLLTATDDDDAALAGLRAGASGWLNKSVGVDALPRVVRGAAAGEAVVSRRLTMRLLDAIRRTSPDGVGIRPVRSPLTPREWEVLDFLCASASTEAIARELVLSPGTVRSHVKNILRKLGVGSRREAVEEARRMRSGLAGVDVTASVRAAA